MCAARFRQKYELLLCLIHQAGNNGGRDCRAFPRDINFTRQLGCLKYE